MHSFPSIRCFFVLWESTPSTGFTLKSSHTAAILAVTSWLVPPTLIVLVAALKALYAAKTTSACLSFDFPPITIVWAA